MYLPKFSWSDWLMICIFTLVYIFLISPILSEFSFASFVSFDAFWIYICTFDCRVAILYRFTYTYAVLNEEWSAFNDILLCWVLICPLTLISYEFPIVTLSTKPIHDDVINWKHFPRYWPFVRGIYRSPANSPHKGQWRGALMFLWSAPWINGWVNSSEAGDLRCHLAHYDVYKCLLNGIHSKCNVFILWVRLSSFSNRFWIV